MTRDMTIDGRRIGTGQPPYVIAEMSGNHNGQLARALELITAAKSAGADAVKMQTYTADTITIDHDGPGFRIESGLWKGRTLYDLYREAHTPWDWHAPMFDHARKLGITLFSSPFDPSAVNLLESLGAPAYKIASFEIVDLPLIQYAARTGKPMIISTGMASLGEIAEAISAARSAGAKEISLLHCTSGYPTPPSEINLRTMLNLGEAFDISVGLSDHTLGIAVPVAAVALGAPIVEKHFTLRRADGGPDSEFSLEPNELKDMVAQCRIAAESVGKVDYELAASEASVKGLRRSLYVVAPIKKGEVFGPNNVRSIRPGLGLAPKHLSEVLGRRAQHDLAFGTPLRWSDIVSDR